MCGNLSHAVISLMLLAGGCLSASVPSGGYLCAPSDSACPSGQHCTCGLCVSDDQQAAKRAAIMRHETQMRLSRRRFVRYARPQEPFGDATAGALPEPSHPVSTSCSRVGSLDVTIDGRRFGAALDGHALFGKTPACQTNLRRDNCRVSVRARGGIRR